jgi:spermidine synthase
MGVQEQLPATGGEGGWTWLGRYWGPIAESAGPIQDEWVPYVEFKLPRARYDGSVNLASLMLWLLQQHPTPAAAMQMLAVDTRDKAEFGRAYVATELTARAWVSSIQGDSAKAGKLIWLAYQANPLDRWIANALADSMLQSLAQAGRQGLSEREALQRILKICPSSAAALRALWHLESAAGNTQAAQRYRQMLLAVSPLDGEAGTLQGLTNEGADRAHVLEH